MALIPCPECERIVSEKAISCPGCGCPIAEPVSVDYGYPTVIEETSKDLKIQILLSTLMIIVGLVWAVFDHMTALPGEESYLQAGIAVVGLLWYFYTRFFIWWHHK